MEDLWRRGEATVGDVRTALNAGGGRERAYTTILTVLQRLHRKRLVTRVRRGRADVYAPAMSAEGYAIARARAEARAVVAEYGEAALASFAEELAHLDHRQRRRLQRLAAGR